MDQDFYNYLGINTTYKMWIKEHREEQLTNIYTSISLPLNNPFPILQAMTIPHSKCIKLQIIIIQEGLFHHRAHFIIQGY